MRRVRPPVRFDDLRRGFRTHRFLAWSAIATGWALRGYGANYRRSDGCDHESPGATRPSIHGLDVCASRPRATAAMPRRFRGATGGATASGAICGTYAPIASERARPIGAGRIAGMNARKPNARDGASSVQAWPTSLTTKCRHPGASICGHSSARRLRSIGSCSRKDPRTFARCCQ